MVFVLCLKLICQVSRIFPFSVEMFSSLAIIFLEFLFTRRVLNWSFDVANMKSLSDYLKI